MRKLAFPIVAALALALPGAGLTATIAVKITATGFSPKTVTINQGDIVKWTNADKVNHQLVAGKGVFASPILKPGQTYSFTFNTAGGYAYHDALHPTLKGAVYVKGPPPSITLGVSAPIVTYGDTTTIGGAVSNQKAGESVVVLVQPYGSSPQQVTTLVTGTSGAFSYTVTPATYTTYSVKWKNAVSQPVVVQVRPRLTLSKIGSRYVAKVAGSHTFAGRSIYLQRHSQFGQWVTVSKLKLGPRSGRIFSMPHRKGRMVYRVYMTTNQAGVGYLDTWSNAVRVTYRR